MLLAFILPLIARTLPEIPVPYLFQYGYTADELLLLLIVATGAGIGARKGFPLWSYTWVVLALGSVATLVPALLATLLLDVVNFRAVAVGVTVGSLVAITHLIAGLVALAFAASRATLGIRYAFFGAAIYLVGSTARPYIIEASNILSPVETAVVNTASIMIAAIMLAVVVAMVMRFLYGDEGNQRRSVYVLIAVALLHPILTGWTFVVESAQPEITNIAGILGLRVLVRWVYVGATLLITGGMVLSFLRIRKALVSNPAPSGGVDG